MVNTKGLIRQERDHLPKWYHLKDYDNVSAYSAHASSVNAI